MNRCLQRQREKSFHEPSALCSLKMCHTFWSFDKVCQFFIKLRFLYMVAKKLYYWHAIFTLKLLLQIAAWKQTYMKRCVVVQEREPRFSVLLLTEGAAAAVFLDLLKIQLVMSCPACVKYMSCHPVLISSSSCIDFLSQPLMSHSESQGTLWHQAKMDGGLTFQQCKAVRVGIRCLQKMMTYNFLSLARQTGAIAKASYTMYVLTFWLSS